MRVYLNKRLLKVLLVVVIAIVVLVGLLKLVSIWDSTHGSVDPDTMQSSGPSSDAAVQAPDVSVREPTDEEREGLADGSITKDDLIQDIVDDAVVKPPGEDQTEQPPKTEYELRMAEIMAEVYVLRDEYIVMLEHMYAEAETALTEENLSEEEFASLISSYLTKATELELQCDGQIDTIVAEMELLIRDNGGDPTLIDSLIETYATEKANKKAWYLQRLEEKGLISS